MRSLHKIVAFGQMSERDARKAGLREARDWQDALTVIGTILLVGLLIGLAWFIAVKGEPGEAVLSGKQERAGEVGTRFVLNREEFKG